MLCDQLNALFVPFADPSPPMTATLPWPDIDTVLLDMDGTLLDLHFDNHFWLELLPQRYAELHGISRAMAELELAPLFNEHVGKLTWYCLDYWSRELNLPIREMKREIAELIALRPSADEFLAALRQAGKRVVLITNAHRDSLSLKLEKIELAPWFDRLISSHDYGYPKEEAQFWYALRQDLEFDPSRALFIDDSLPILRSARRFGIAHLLAVREPDSRRAPKDTEEFAAVEDYRDLASSLTGPLACRLALPWVGQKPYTTQQLPPAEPTQDELGPSNIETANAGRRDPAFAVQKPRMIDRK